MDNFTNIDWAHEYRAEQLDLTCYWELSQAEFNVCVALREADDLRDSAREQAAGWDLSGLHMNTGHFDRA